MPTLGFAPRVPVVVSSEAPAGSAGFLLRGFFFALLLLVVLSMMVFLGAGKLAAGIADLLRGRDPAASLSVGLRQVGATLTLLLLGHCR